MKKAAMRFAAVLFAVSVALTLLTGVALAASVYGSGGDSYIRSQPNLSGSQLGLFPEGASADYLGNSSVDGRGVTWYKISYRGKTGWVSSKYTSLSGGSSGSGYDAIYATGGDSNIRSTPSLSGGKIGLFPEGAVGTYLDEDSWDDRGVVWYRIRYNGMTGWVSSRYASLSEDYYVDQHNYEYEPSYSYGTIYTSGDTYLRTSPNISAAQIIVIPDGDTAIYLGETTNDSRGVTWYYAGYQGLAGWVSSKYASLSRAGAGSIYGDYNTVYGSGGDSYIRSQPNLSGSQLGTFPDGASADYLGSSSVDGRGVTWYKISYRGKTGWVSSKYTYLN